jgi:NifB/MoaA-like Fe-S oxidoreductase
VIAQVERWQRKLRRRLGLRFAYLTDEWYLQTERPVPPRSAYDGLALEENGLGMVRAFLDDWKRVRREVDRRRAAGELDAARGRRLTLATGTLFAPTLARAAAEFSEATGVQLDVVAVPNVRLGHTITVAGLLMAEDLVLQLRAAGPGDLVVLPRIMFDHPDGISLDDRSPREVARALGRPVALADAMGDVLDALLGENALTVDPDAPEVELEVVRGGGWAVEKYL